MPELTRADLARLAALAEPYKDEGWRALEAQGDSYTAEPEWFVGMVPNDAGGWWDWDSSLLNRERAEFLVAAKNAIPQLCEALIAAWDLSEQVQKQLIAERDEALARLEEYRRPEHWPEGSQMRHVRDLEMALAVSHRREAEAEVEIARLLPVVAAARLVAESADPPMPPSLAGETPEQYTNRLTGADRTDRAPYPEHRNRQCSIGYHDECSDPGGERCKCPCHRLGGRVEALRAALDAANKDKEASE